MSIECQYDCEYHRGKTEFHHPVSRDGTVGLYLCEAHHALLRNRAKRYKGEMIIDKTLAEMRDELKAMELSAVLKAGYQAGDIDKG